MEFTPNEANDIRIFAKFLRTHDAYFLYHCVEPYVTKQNGSIRLLLPSVLSWDEHGSQERTWVKNFVRCALPSISENNIVFTSWQEVMQKRLEKELLDKPLGNIAPLFGDAAPIGKVHARYIAYYVMQFHHIEKKESLGGWHKICHAYTPESIAKELRDPGCHCFENFNMLAAWGTSYNNYKWSEGTARLWFQYKRLKEHPFYTSRYFKLRSMECGSFEPAATRELPDGEWEISWSVSSNFGISDEEKSLIAKASLSI